MNSSKVYSKIVKNSIDCIVFSSRFAVNFPWPSVFWWFVQELIFQLSIIFSWLWSNTQCHSKAKKTESPNEILSLLDSSPSCGPTDTPVLYFWRPPRFQISFTWAFPRLCVNDSSDSSSVRHLPTIYFYPLHYSSTICLSVLILKRARNILICFRSSISWFHTRSCF